METENQQNHENSENIQSVIFCIFKTHLPAEYKVEEDVIELPTSLNEKALNENLVQLLQAQHDDEGPTKFQNMRFEFMIKSEFLRGTLRSHILKHDLMTEKTIEIWYTFSLQPPKEDKKAEEEDWVSCLTLLKPFEPSKCQPVIASLYNGSISVYSENLKHLYRHQVTDASIKAVGIQQNYLSGSANEYLVFTACEDETMRVGNLNYEVQKGKVNIGFTEIADCIGSESQLQCLDLNILQNNLVCVGNYKGDILVYSLTNKYLEEAPSVGGEGVGKKKVKLSKKQLDPITKISIHHDRVSNVYWKDSDRILSSSHDHHIKLYDTSKQAEVNDITCKDSAVTAMFPTRDFILSGHEDNTIKTWDLREKAPAKVFKSHTSWISSIKGLETDSNIFLTTSYDHTVKIWDMRSTFPLFTLKTHHDKVLCGIWNGSASVISGGSDNQIVSHLFNGQ
ncbi:hypothetical protein ABPG72_021403 [Tetrahymena utriculariae]